MLIKNKLSELMELSCLETNQEGMLRGGFAMLNDLSCGHSGTNGNCSCNTDSSGCKGNDNCQCNATCSHNCDCNCNCVTTPAPEKPEQPTGPTDGKKKMTMGFFTF